MKKEVKKRCWGIAIAIIIFLLTIFGAMVWQALHATVKYGTPHYRPKIQ
ncbi:Uncharacterised protein [uncultured archaeon]|nr:Uncharacterised protein [uncultured archaeon]